MCVYKCTYVINQSIGSMGLNPAFYQIQIVNMYTTYVIQALTTYLLEFDCNDQCMYDPNPKWCYVNPTLNLNEVQKLIYLEEMYVR